MAVGAPPLLLRIVLSDGDSVDGGGSGEHPEGSHAGGGVDGGLRNLPLTAALRSLSTHEVLRELEILDGFRRTCDNLYQRVRALFFLYAAHRFHLPERRNAVERGRRRDGAKGDEDLGPGGLKAAASGEEKDRAVRDESNIGEDGRKGEDVPLKTFVCPKGYAALLDRRFEEAIDFFLASVPLSPSALPVTPGEDLPKDSAGDDWVPRRTSLVSNLGRMDSTNSEGSRASSFFRYSIHSSCKSLEGENLISYAAVAASGGMGDNAIGTPQQQQQQQQQLELTKHQKSILEGARQSTEQKSLLLPSDATSSALAKAYRSLAFQTLADQVKSSVRSHPGNEWMFNLPSVNEHPLRWERELLGQDEKGFPKDGQVLLERTPVRMDLSHSCWSDIFFLGMDYPEAARVINCSVDLAVRESDGGGGDDAQPAPPIECRLRLTTAEPGTIRLTSVDLKASALLTRVSQVFDYGADYLGLLKAGLVASGIVPSGLEQSCKEEDIPMRDLISAMMPDGVSNGDCPYGLELTTYVRGIPKGSRLAVSTNLLGSIIALSMRATSQTSTLTGGLLEPERRLVAARAILGEWLGGSGGGWQDSGGLWPGLKLIHGVAAMEGDPEWGVSRGRLLPRHRLLRGDEAPPELLRRLEQSLVLVHGGMAQNVGPILEMVTEKYLLRDEEEWHARHRAMEILDDLLAAFRESNVRKIARLVTENFFGPIRTVIPWATNHYTETLISRVQERFADDFWGFWMLGGMSGGGMGFIFDPSAKPAALKELGNIMLQTKRDMEYSLPFAMDPVVFEYRVNQYGTVAQLIDENADDVDVGSNGTQTLNESTTLTQNLNELLEELGFDRKEQEQIRTDLRNGTIGLAKNRLSPESKLEDVTADDVVVIDEDSIAKDTRARGLEALASGKVAVVTLAAGVGSRWTQGAGVVKALHPYCCIGGKHRTFLDVHLAKNWRVSSTVGTPVPHIFTTSWMTDAPIASHVASLGDQPHNIPIYISKGRAIGLRMVPMVRDLKFLWEEQSQQRLDEQAEKVRDSVNAALKGWAESSGEGCDYTDNVPKQCLSPVGHWYEVPNLLLNGTLAKLLKERPQVTTLMLHNIDTIGANVDAAILGKFLETGSTLAIEVVPRCIDDMGGGLCRVDGKPRLVEGLALPSEDDELKFSYYNSLTTWIDIDKLLSKFGLERNDILECSEKIPPAINSFSRALPTYVTVKEVKKRWGKGQEDVHPVAQYEKLWGDISSVEGIDCSYFVVPRLRGQQLKDPAQLDGWSRDGSAAYLDSICSW